MHGYAITCRFGRSIGPMASVAKGGMGVFNSRRRATSKTDVAASPSHPTLEPLHLEGILASDLREQLQRTLGVTARTYRRTRPDYDASVDFGGHSHSARIAWWAKQLAISQPR